MPASELLQLAKAGRYDEFETRCLELIESGQLVLAQLRLALEQLVAAGQGERAATLVPMVFDAIDPGRDLQAALALARMALTAAPDSADLRRVTIDLYRRVYGAVPGFAALLEASGLAGGRPVRSALNLLDLCLTLQPGDTLISRSDGRVAEVTDIDRAHGLFTLRRAGRVTTLPAPEVAREYDRVAPEDFRVLRQLRPERLGALIRDDPVALVIGLIHAHGGHIDADLLKHELTPKYIESKEWPAWWSKARTLLKRSPHVVVEGRSPMILSHSAVGRTLEEDSWGAFEAQSDPVEWLATVEGYLREKASRKEAPDAELMQRFHDRLAADAAAARARRPAGALASALVIGRLREKGLPATEETAGLAVAILKESPEPAAVLAALKSDVLRTRGLQALQAARPADWSEHVVAWLLAAPAALLDDLAASALEAGRADAIQSFIDSGLADPAHHPELLYWLWKGPKQAAQLRLPPDADLLRLILDTLSSLGRTVTAEKAVVKEFRQRMKAALALRDFDKVRRCLAECSPAAAITVRRQLQRLEGLGQVVQWRLVELMRAAHPQLWLEPVAPVARWEDEETIWTTAAGIARRTAERDELMNVKMPENAKRIGEAASYGDLSENSEYRFALEERDLLRARLASINDELARARPLEPHDVPLDHAGIGSRVTLRRVADGAETVMTFLGTFDTDVERGVYNYQAPVAKRIMGRRVGERVQLTIDGREVEFEIAALTSGVEQPQ
jgi:transcription elongation GreA/GreB family factor